MEPKFVEMEIDSPWNNSGPRREMADLSERPRRPQTKDQLLAENPPWTLSAGILVIAAILGAAVIAARNIEYQETIPISLVLREDEIPGFAYGAGWLPQSLAAKVKLDQPVLIELNPPAGAGVIQIEGQVSQVTATCQDSLYQVRIKLPAAFSSDPEKARALRHEARAQGKIVTWSGKLISRMFTLFSNL
jgi:hypothetical protein